MEALRTVLVLAAARAARAAKECIIFMIMNCRYSVEPCENAAGPRGEALAIAGFSGSAKAQKVVHVRLPTAH